MTGAPLAPRTPGPAIVPMVVLAVLAALATLACGDDDAARSVPVGEGDGSMPRELAVVQVAAFADSAPAARLRDSLVAAGWQVLVRHQPGDTMPPWRVRVAPTPHLDMARLIVAGFQAAGYGGGAVMLRDVAVLDAPAVQGIRVNRGAPGVRTRVRWTLSPERDALLVVEDARGADNLPFPDGFLLATERSSAGEHPVLQRDSVWDVAPSPDWERVAFGRAYLIRAEGRDSVTWRHWSVIGRRANLEVTTVNEGGFLVNPSNNLHSFVQPVIESIGAPPSAVTGVTQRIADAIPAAGGWRVAWSADGATLGVGMPPRTDARDDSPPVSWRAVEVERRLLTGSLRNAASLRRASWTEGPELQAGISSAAAPILHFDEGRVEGRDGWVVVFEGTDDRRGRVIGPGIPLAVTRRGRFIAAIAPVPDPRPNEPSFRALVYRME